MRSGPARVLEALRRAGSRTCSGAVLSAREGVSRAQVWKHVEALRALGYKIEAAPGDGYRLSEIPDRLYPEEIHAGLETAWLARDIRYFDRTDSTNRVALELAREGAEHGTTVVAEGQTAGRGRLGRSFFSPPHCNLYTSLVLRPTLTTREAPSLIPASAVAVAECVTAEVADEAAVEIKWPNDVLLGGRKTSGILMEMNAEATQVDFLVLGIGVNLNVDPARFPEELRGRATSVLGHTGRRVDRLAFTRRLYGGLEQALERHAAGGFEALRSRYEAFFRMAGSAVRVTDLHGGAQSGVALGVDADGALRLRTDSGETGRVLAGDVTLAPGASPNE